MNNAYAIWKQQIRSISDAYSRFGITETDVIKAMVLLSYGPQTSGDMHTDLRSLFNWHDNKEFLEKSMNEMNLDVAMD